MNSSRRRHEHSFRHLSDAINDAVILLEKAEIDPPASSGPLPPRISLLEECIDLCRRSEPLQSEPIRTIHHFACTGGTIISKSLAAMPNVQLLSEVDPLSTMGRQDGKPKFAPTDMITLLAQGTRPAEQVDVIQAFVSQLQLILERANHAGAYLVLRDHAHSHFCVGTTVHDRPTLREIVTEIAPPLSLVTIRNPIDSYTSLVRNKWVHFQPPTFDEYCRRYLIFLEKYEAVPMLFYEDFVQEPESTMRLACHLLQLPFTDMFKNLHQVFKLTGDSGRRTSEIGQRPPLTERAGCEIEARESKFYHILIQKLEQSRLV